MTVASAMVALAGVLTWASATAQPSRAGANETVPAISNSQLLTNPSFEQKFSGWHVTGSEQASVYAGHAAEDDHYLETNAGSGAVAGSSVYQDAGVNPLDGHDYRGSFMLRSPTGTTQTVLLAVWALGGGLASEVETTSVTVSSTSWTRYSADLTVGAAGYDDLRLQLYSDVNGSPNVDVDAAMLQDAGLTNASFEQGMGSWDMLGSDNEMIYPNGAAEDSDYLQWNTSQAGGSLYQDVYTAPSAGSGYQGGIMMRSPTGATVQAELVLWALQAPGVYGPVSVPAITTVTLSSTSWQLETVQLDVKRNGFTALRLQVYLETTDANLDVDEASLLNSGVANAAFTYSLTGWTKGSSTMNAAVDKGAGSEDGHYLEMNTGSGTLANVSTRAPASITAGAAYDGYAWLRSPSGRDVTVNLRLTTYGGKVEQGATTQVTLSSTAWTLHSVELSPTRSGYDGLSILVGLVTHNRNVDIGGVDVDVPHGVTATDPCVYTPTDFANAFLDAIPEPDTADNVEAIVAWEMAEGGNWYNTAKFNPLDTTQPYDGSTAIAGNPDGIQAYKDWSDGVEATVITIENGYYSGILAALAAGNDPNGVANAVGNSPWGTPNFTSLLGQPYDPPAPSWETAAC